MATDNQQPNRLAQVNNVVESTDPEQDDTQNNTDGIEPYTPDNAPNAFDRARNISEMNEPTERERSMSQPDVADKTQSITVSEESDEQSFGENVSDTYWNIANFLYGGAGDLTKSLYKRWGEMPNETRRRQRELNQKIERLKKDNPEMAEEIDALTVKPDSVPSWKKIGAQAVQTALELAPVGKIKAISKLIQKGGAKGMATLAGMGAGFGGGYMGAEAVEQDKSLEEGLKDTGVGIVAGGAIGPLGSLVARGGKKLATIKPVRDAMNKVTDQEAYKWFARRSPHRSVGGVLSKDMGEVGNQVMKGIFKADRNTQSAVGRVMMVGRDLGIVNEDGFWRKVGNKFHIVQSNKMSREQAYQLQRAVKGQVPPQTGQGVSRGDISFEAGEVTGRIGKSGDEVGAGVRGRVGDKYADADYTQQDQVNFLRAAYDDVRKEAAYKGVRVRVPTQGDEPTKFVKPDWQENYVPRQVLQGDRLAKDDEVREYTIRQAMDDGAFESREAAEAAMDDWIKMSQKGEVSLREGQNDNFIKYLMKSGQADNRTQAVDMMNEFFNKHQSDVKLASNLENARIVDHPFYNPFPDEVLPVYMADSMKRLSLIDEFGVKYNQGAVSYPKIDNARRKMHDRLRESEGGVTADKLLDEFDDFLETALERKSYNENLEKGMRILRASATPLLAFAQIPNAVQSITASTLKGDLRSALYGLKAVVSNKGARQALESGAITQNVINNFTEYAGGVGKAGDYFLRGTGFSWTERFNRIVASNAGENWAKRAFERAVKGGRVIKGESGRKYYMDALEELGINAKKALQRGKLTDEELLKASQVFSEKTQFRSRPSDMPIWASHPIGKVSWQFKNFIFNQTRLVLRDSLYRQFTQRGMRGKVRGLRNLGVLATLYPMAGEVVQDARSLITGQERPTNALDRYIENLASAGASGVILSVLEASKFDSTLSMLTGPGPGNIGGLIDSAVDIEGDFDAEGLAKEFLKYSGVGRPLADEIGSSYNDPDRETFLETLETSGRNIDF